MKYQRSTVWMDLFSLPLVLLICSYSLIFWNGIYLKLSGLFHLSFIVSFIQWWCHRQYKNETFYSFSNALHSLITHFTLDIRKPNITTKPKNRMKGEKEREKRSKKLVNTPRAVNVHAMHYAPACHPYTLHTQISNEFLWMLKMII